MKAMPSVLVVDDDDISRRLVSSALTVEGFSLTQSASGEEAIRILKRGCDKFSLVVTDALMQDGDGFDLCRRMKAHDVWRYIPVIIVSSLGETHDVVRGLEAGADDYVAKPVVPSVLRARARVLIGIHNRYRELAGQDEPQVGANVLKARIVRAATEAGLSAREREVLDLIMLGRTSDQVAAVLGTATRTAKFHISNILRKLGLDSRNELPRLLL